MQSVREANTTCLVVRRPGLAKKRWKMKYLDGGRKKGGLPIANGGLHGARALLVGPQVVAFD
jgi:hypothetical protein